MPSGSLNQLDEPIRNEFLEMYSSPMVGLPDREGTTILQNAMYLQVMQSNILEAINSPF
jgi:hypothetical protein